MYSCAGHSRAEAIRAALAHARRHERAAPPAAAATAARAGARATRRHARRSAGRAAAIIVDQASLTRAGVRRDRAALDRSRSSAGMRERERHVRRRAAGPRRAPAIRPGRPRRRGSIRRSLPSPIRLDRRTDKNQSDKSISSKTDNVQPACRSGFSPVPSSRARAGSPRTSVVLPAPSSPRKRHDHPAGERRREARAGGLGRGGIGEAQRASTWRRRAGSTAVGRGHRLRCRRRAAALRCSACRSRHATPTRPIARGDAGALAAAIRRWGRELGFDDVGIADTDLAPEEARLVEWLAAGRHGAMDYMARHGVARARPAELVPGTLRVITARLNYLPRRRAPGERGARGTRRKAYVSRYALGRDYHKVLRRRLQHLAERIAAARSAPFGHRVFTDSAPVLEVALAAKAGLGWRGKHTLLLDPRAGLVVLPGRDLHRPAAADDAGAAGALRHLPRVHRRLPDRRDRRAVRARRAPLHLVPHDRARRQHPGGAAAADRQSRSTAATTASSCARGTASRGPPRVPDFAVRNGLDDADLVDAVRLDAKPSSTRRMEGSAIRRIGYERWSRNLAVGARQRAPRRGDRRGAAHPRADDPSPLVREHVAWALARQAQRQPDDGPALRRSRRQRISWFIDTIGSITASTSTSTIAAHRDDQRRLQQRREPGEAPLGLALELRRGALEHRRELPARLAVGDEVDEHRREHALLLQARATETPSRTRSAASSAARRNGSAQTTSRAASSERSSGAPLPTRIASVLAKRAVSMAVTQAAQRPAGAAGARASAPETRRAGWRARTPTATIAAPASQTHRCAEERADRDQRAGEPRQRLPALLVDGDDLRHDVDEQHGDHRERDHRHERRDR